MIREEIKKLKDVMLIRFDELLLFVVVTTVIGSLSNEPSTNAPFEIFHTDFGKYSANRVVFTNVCIFVPKSSIA